MVVDIFLQLGWRRYRPGCYAVRSNRDGAAPKTVPNSPTRPKSSCASRRRGGRKIASCSRSCWTASPSCASMPPGCVRTRRASSPRRSRWFAVADEEWPLSFVNVCRTLGLDPPVLPSSAWSCELTDLGARSRRSMPQSPHQAGPTAPRGRARRSPADAPARHATPRRADPRSQGVRAARSHPDASRCVPTGSADRPPGAGVFGWAVNLSTRSFETVDGGLPLAFAGASVHQAGLAPEL